MTACVWVNKCPPTATFPFACLYAVCWCIINLPLDLCALILCLPVLVSSLSGHTVRPWVRLSRSHSRCHIMKSACVFIQPTASTHFSECSASSTVDSWSYIHKYSKFCTGSNKQTGLFVLQYYSNITSSSITVCVRVDGRSSSLHGALPQ